MAKHNVKVSLWRQTKSNICFRRFRNRICC